MSRIFLGIFMIASVCFAGCKMSKHSSIYDDTSLPKLEQFSRFDAPLNDSSQFILKIFGSNRRGQFLLLYSDVLLIPENNDTLVFNGVGTNGICVRIPSGRYTLRVISQGYETVEIERYPFESNVVLDMGITLDEGYKVNKFTVK